jgi:hypothetical protein
MKFGTDALASGEVVRHRTRRTNVDAREPTADDLARARAEREQHAHDRVAARTESWREQAERIENDMSDAVERAEAMGDHVEPSLLPPERRTGETPAEDRGAAEDPDTPGYDRSSGSAKDR